MEDLFGIYKTRKDEILSRLQGFRGVWKSGDERVFKELCFCLFTPQSGAERCWNAVKKLDERGLLLKGNEKQIRKHLKDVRFYKTKARHLVLAREMFMENGKIRIKKRLSRKTSQEKRGWLVDNVKGLGYKEASHFLRNIGVGEDIAILDRHILRNLAKYNVIGGVPRSLTPKKYLEIEEKMRAFSAEKGIPLPELDLLFWAKETGKVFK